jgi:probable F420-dependent oxidoreductase
MNKFRPFRFGVLVPSAPSKEDWIAKARRVEALGYSTLLMPDHFSGYFAPIPALLTAAQATSSLRVGSFVMDNDFHHPTVLAKECATLDLLSGGRLELGLGAGWMTSDYEQTGIPLDSAGIRVSRLEESLHILKGLFADGPLTFEGKHYTVRNLEGMPKSQQRPHPPLMIGGAGKRMLSIAAHEADIVSIAARPLADGTSLDVTDMTPEATERKINLIRQEAGERFDDLELNTLVFAVAVTQDREQVADQVAKQFQTTSEQLLQMPNCLIGTPEQISKDLLAHRERYGISYFTIFGDSLDPVFGDHLETFAPVVARLAGK